MGEPAKIRKLAEAVINRIAAGEVVIRPANALKELIENSLDAKATQIHITVKNGGLKLLQIQDNGTGIHRDDFPIVCERFTTSKLETFEDLQAISTYGFRGEALASISHIAHLNIVSKTLGDPCAYQASFVDGKMVGAPKPTAGNQGTIISVEDLFYNMNVRKRALQSPAEEYKKISDVVGRYAVHNSLVGFALKKSGENTDIRTGSNATPSENIAVIYGSNIAKELFEVKFENIALKFKVEGLMTNVNYSTKNFVFLLFINHRLVECPSLKRCIDQVYATYLPKNSHAFVYLSLELDPVGIDVNVHPTKHQVHFLNEELITEAITQALDAKLLRCNNSRVFYTQAKLPGVVIETKEKLKVKDASPKDLVRTDCTTRKLDKFLVDMTASKQEESETTICQKFLKKVTRVDTKLTTVLELRKTVEQSCHRALRETFAQHVFVGAITMEQALIQYSTKLFLCNTKKILQELFYQFFLYNFQKFDCISLENSLSVEELALMALNQAESGWTEDDGDKRELARKVREILVSKAEMCLAYFSLELDETRGTLKTLPVLLDNYVPDFAFLPMYLLRLATEVNWDEEKSCFEDFGRETARFYSNIPEEFEGNDWKWMTEHLLYPAVKAYFIPGKEFTENAAVLEVANLPNLYKVFERC